MPDEALHNTLKVQRAMRNLTQADLAERARVSPGSIHRLERAEPGVALWVWLNAMEALGLLGALQALRDPATEAILAAAAVRAPRGDRGASSSRTMRCIRPQSRAARTAVRVRDRPRAG